VGAGAIGGFLAVRLAKNEEVCVIARGDHLSAIQNNGLSLIQDNETTTVNIFATSDIREAGQFDVVFICVKSHQIEPIVDDLSCLCHDSTVFVTTQNGIPWWYFQQAEETKIPVELRNSVIESVDPKGVISSKIDPKRIIGCVVYPAAFIQQPGVIQHVEGIRFPIGELDGIEKERTTKISNMLIDAGFKSPILSDIRSELWLKCWGSCCFNPISALTGGTLQKICTYNETRELATCTMQEAYNIGIKLGATFRVSLERRLNGAAAVGEHKTSMLQDIEDGRTPEIEALVGSVVELGKLTNIPTPHLFTLYSCVKLLSLKSKN